MSSTATPDRTPQQPVGGPLSPVPRSRVPWMTWVWIGFLVVVVVLTIVGFFYMESPMF